MNLTGKMSATAWALTSILLFFAIALISIIPLFAAHTATYAVLPTTFVKNNTPQAFNLNITVNPGSADNITSINITLPPSFALNSFANLSGAGFACTNVSVSLINCSNSSANGLNPAAPFVIIQINATPQVATGTYNWVVNTTDTAGAVNGSAVATQVDSNVPTCSVIVSNDSYVRNGDSINFTATCTDVGSGISSVYLNLTSVNASAIVQAVSSGGGNYSAIITASAANVLNAPVYVLNITDNVGYTNATLTPVALVTVDSTNPVVVAGPTRYPGVQNWAKNGNTITLNATVTDAPAGVYSVTVNGSQIGASEAITFAYDGTNYVNSTVLVGNVASGQKNLTVTATDNSSNVNNSVTLTVFVDNANPAVSAFAVNDSTVRTGWSVFFSAVVSDSHSGINASSVFVLNSSGATTQLSSTDGSTFNGSVLILESEGTYLYNLTVSDNVTNANTTQSVTIIVDNTAPAVTPRATIYPATQTAAKQSQYVNVNATVDANISGLYIVTVNASSIGLAASVPLAQQGSTNHYNVTLLVNISATATASLRITAVDNSSNVNSTESVSVIVDNTNPTVAALPTKYPGVQTQARTGQAITLNASVSDVGSGVYSVRVNGSSIGASESIPLLFDGANYVNATVVIVSGTTGTKNLSVTATDNASNTNTTTTLAVIIDNTNPVVQSFAANDTTVKTGDSVFFTAVVNDTNSGVNASSVFVINSTGGLWQLASADGFAFNGTVFVTEAAGTYLFNLTVSDNVGNANSTQTVNITVDNTNPTVAANPTAYPSGQTYAKSGDSITLNATVVDATSGLASVTVNASALGLSSSLTLSGAGSEKTAAVNVNSTASGTVTLLVTAIDNSGNVNSTISLSVNIDSTNPVVTANSPTYPGIQTWVKNGQAITLNATVTDATAGVKTVTVNASVLNGSATLALVKDGSSDNYNNTLTVSGATSDGTKSLLVTATDNANNVNNTVSLSVKVDATAPVVTITSPANAANVSGTYLITLTVNDTSSGVNVSSIALYINNAAQARTCTDIGTFANCSFSWVTGADGTYIINATALDNATNPGVSTQITVTVDNSAPSLAVNRPVGGETLTDTLIVNASVSDDRLNTSSCQYRVVNASSTIADWSALPYSGGYCLANASTKAYPVGVLNVSLRVSDMLGNQNLSTVQVSSVAAIWVNSVTGVKTSAYTAGSDYLEFLYNVTLKGGTRVKLKLSCLTSGSNAYCPEGQTTITSGGSTYNVQQNYTDSTGIIPVNGTFTLRYNVPGGMVAGTYTANYGTGLYS